MRAAVIKERGLMEVEEFPTPEPGPGEVLVGIKYCGICGSDLHFYDTDLPTPGGRLGHEFSGVIAAVGEGETDWRVGDRVVPSILKPCGQCRWRKMGHFNLCLGGPALWRKQKFPDYVRGFANAGGAFADYIKVPGWRLLRVPDEVSLEEAALAEPLSVALHAVRRSGIMLGDYVAVLGAGPIGLLALQCAKQAGALRVFVAEGAEWRAQAAAKLGADVVINPREADVIQEIIRETEIGPDIVYECAAVPATIEGSIDLVRRGGKVMFVGMRMEPADLVTADWVLKQVQVEATYAGDIPRALELLKYHRIDVDTLVTDIVPLERIQETFQAMLKPSAQIKVLVEP